MGTQASIVDILRGKAEKSAEGRRIAEFGPAGGNPKAEAEQELEWKAAEYIEILENRVKKLQSQLDEVCELVYSFAKGEIDDNSIIDFVHGKLEDL